MYSIRNITLDSLERSRRRAHVPLWDANGIGSEHVCYEAAGVREACESELQARHLTSFGRCAALERPPPALASRRARKGGARAGAQARARRLARALAALRLLRPAASAARRPGHRRRVLYEQQKAARLLHNALQVLQGSNC